MASLTHDPVRTSRESGAHRAAHPGGLQPARRVTMAAVCYVGLAVIVGLTIVLTRVAPTAVAASVFLLGAILVVGALHPRFIARAAHRR